MVSSNPMINVKDQQQQAVRRSRSQQRQPIGLYPGGIKEISRWLSVATPPVHVVIVVRPWRGRTDTLCDPSRVEVLGDLVPVVSLRSTTG